MPPSQQRSIHEDGSIIDHVCGLPATRGSLVGRSCVPHQNAVAVPGRPCARSTEQKAAVLTWSPVVCATPYVRHCRAHVRIEQCSAHVRVDSACLSSAGRARNAIIQCDCHARPDCHSGFHQTTACAPLLGSFRAPNASTNACLFTSNNNNISRPTSCASDDVDVHLDEDAHYLLKTRR